MVLVTWWGHSSLEFRTESNRILCDPIDDRSLCSQIGETSVAPNAIFVSHSHWDHYSPSTLSRLASESTILFGAEGDVDFSLLPGSMGSVETRLLQAGDVVDLGDTAVEVFVSSEGVSYLFTFKKEDLVAFFMGDSLVLQPMKAIQADFVFFPFWLLKNERAAPALHVFLENVLSVPVHFHRDPEARPNFYVSDDEFARLTEEISHMLELPRGEPHCLCVDGSKVAVRQSGPETL